MKNLQNGDTQGPVAPLEAKKLLQRRRDILNTYSFSAFQFQMAQKAVFLKNRNFLRQLRSLEFNNYVFVEENNDITIYKHQKTNQQFVLKQTRDDYRYFQLEYFVDQLNCNQGYRYITRFLAPSAVFYTTTSTYQLVSMQQMQVRMVPIKKYFTDLSDPQKLNKRSINQAFYVFEHLLNMLSLLHGLGLSLSGEFGQLYFVGEILKLDLVNLTIRIPETHAEGIKKDLLQLKVQLETIFQIQFRRHLSAQHLVLMLQQVLDTIDGFIESNSENNCGLSRGLSLNEASSLISRLPFFGQQRYMTFVDSKDEFAIPFRVELEQSQRVANKIAHMQQIRRIHIMKQLDDAIETVQHTGFYMRPLSAGALRKIQAAKQAQQNFPGLQNNNYNANNQQNNALEGPKAAKRPIDQPVTLQRLKRTNSIADETAIPKQLNQQVSMRQYDRGFQGRRCHSGAVYSKKETVQVEEEVKVVPERQRGSRPQSTSLRQYDELLAQPRPPVDNTMPMDVFDDEMEQVRQKLSRLQERSIQLTTSQLRVQNIRERISTYAEKCLKTEKINQFALSGTSETNSFRLSTPQPIAQEFPHKQGQRCLKATLSGLKSTTMEVQNIVTVHGRSIARQPDRRAMTEESKEKRLHMNSREESKRSPQISFQQIPSRPQSNDVVPVECKKVNVNKSTSLPVKGKTQKRHRILQEVPMEAIGNYARAQVQINMQALKARGK